MRPVGDEGVRLRVFVRAYCDRAAVYDTSGTTPLIAAFRWWMEVLAGWQVFETQRWRRASVSDGDDYLEMPASLDGLDTQCASTAAARDVDVYLGMPALLDCLTARCGYGRRFSISGLPSIS